MTIEDVDRAHRVFRRCDSPVRHGEKRDSAPARGLRQPERFVVTHRPHPSRQLVDVVQRKQQKRHFSRGEQTESRDIDRDAIRRHSSSLRKSWQRQTPDHPILCASHLDGRANAKRARLRGLKVRRDVTSPSLPSGRIQCNQLPILPVI